MSSKRNHGLSRTPEYVTWCNMIARCECPRRRDFVHYGGRGIKVCQRWRDSFLAFLEDVGKRPFPRATLERKRVDEGYCPDNCEWTSQRSQTRNKRNNHLITHNGKTQCVADWADEFKMPSRLLWDRLFRYGWPIEEALTPNKKLKWNRRTSRDTV